ncbi:MAG: DUF4019 domain-containing protein [Pseudomonadota bacterium]|nr:DUF4019 domain-containing protein [Pseudomonadota bacterium]
MSRSFGYRAQLLFALIWLAWLVAGSAVAQDPKATAAQATARDWLALADRSDAQASWNTAGKKFQAAMPLRAWTDALAKARTPLGPVKSRTISNTDFRKKFQNFAEGDYALIVYATSFTNKARAQESLTLEHEPDGKWRVVGYFIR